MTIKKISFSKKRHISKQKSFSKLKQRSKLSQVKVKPKKKSLQKQQHGGNGNDFNQEYNENLKKLDYKVLNTIYSKGN